MADLSDGESVEMQGSGKAPYILKNIGGVYSCSCPAWRNQSAPIEQRTCKHLRKLRGDDAEKERIGTPLPVRVKKSANESETAPVLLAHTWDGIMDLSGWWMSEKLDGVRAYFDGKQLLSRQGNLYHAPKWFLAGFPDTPLDGELWIDRGEFQRTVSIVRRMDQSDHWKEVRYLVFDAPAIKGPFEKRYEQLKQLVQHASNSRLTVLDQNRCRDNQQIETELDKIEALGGEGLMLREPGSPYEVGRSMTLLKVKRFLDQEATIVGHQAGRGKHKGKLGALEVELENGTRFKIGTGFSNHERACPPDIGSIVTFRYQELTKDGVPRFPSFMRIREGTSSPYQPSSKAKKKTAPDTKVSDAKTIDTVTEPQKEAGTANDELPKRYFELSDGKSNKFWEVAVTDNAVTVRYGRIGTNGTTKTKDFKTHELANQHADKLISQKQSKGYKES